MKIDWPHRGHAYSKQEIDAVVEIMSNPKIQLTQGSRVLKFEEDFMNYLGSENAFSLMSAAHGLDISANLIEIQKGDEVIIPAHTYCATALAYARRGAIIKWADICPNSLTVTLESISKLITPKTKAVVVVHLYGLICPDIYKISDFLKNKSIFLIEDCAQSLGAKFKGKHCGTIGDIGVFSFHSQKNLTTLGEGGMMVVKDQNLAKHVKGLRLNGHAPFTNKDEYWLPAMSNVDEDISGIWPIKSSMNEAQGVIGSLIIGRMDSLTDSRRSLSNFIRTKLKNQSELKFQEIHSEAAHSHHLLPLMCISDKWNRDDLIKLLFNKYDIKCVIQYYPLNRYDLFKKRGMANANVPNTDKFYDNMISLPFSLTLSEEESVYLVDSIIEAVRELNK
jgi:perosamine synthetase